MSKLPISLNPFLTKTRIKERNRLKMQSQMDKRSITHNFTELIHNQSYTHTQKNLNITKGK